ncbi:MAG: ABC transporter ATP-binding protein [Rubrivivax sp.]|nr:ABC transporter ATP-binding protein [Rubrivivax sp.]
MSEAALLQVVGVGRDYDRGAVRALGRVTFSAGAGQTLALTGPSGCGKSTLLSLIGLLDRPDRGHIEVLGLDLATIRSAHAFRAGRVGFVFQFHHMVASMTLQENVEAPMLALGVPRAERRSRAAQLLDAMGLGPRAGFLPSHVSGGERQRAAVARALVNRPALVLADEPTGNLDSRNGQCVIELLVAHARQHQALVLIATHNPEIAAAMDARIELRDGERV